jgi:sulfatase maturation enzyme AslB (radical SAM superfamily)
MKAQIKPRIDLYNRDELIEAIPLRTPYVIYIDPCDKCNFQCKFCPTGDRELMKNTRGRGHGIMDFELYKSLMDSICEFEDKVNIIRLYKDGEPLLHPRFADMVRYAKESGCCERVDTTTNASLLNPELSLGIIDAGLDRINISVEGVNAEQYADFSRYTLDYDKFVENIAFFYEHRKQCEMNIKINGDILTAEQQQHFFDTFGDITDGISVEHVIDYWPTFKQDKVDVNETVGILGNEIHEVKVCPYILYEMVINSDGTYSMCRFDWKRCLLLGNELGLYKSPKKVWDSIHLWQLQRKFLSGERTWRPFCSKCGELKQGMPEDLDEYAEMLLERF